MDTIKEFWIVGIVMMAALTGIFTAIVAAFAPSGVWLNPLIGGGFAIIFFTVLCGLIRLAAGPDF